jgi:hypothetical protein
MEMNGKASSGQRTYHYCTKKSVMCLITQKLVEIKSHYNKKMLVTSTQVTNFQRKKKPIQKFKVHLYI